MVGCGELFLYFGFFGVVVVGDVGKFVDVFYVVVVGVVVYF